MSTWIEPLDLFGLGQMRWRDQVLRECLTDQARYDASDRSRAVVDLSAPGRRGRYVSRVVIEVAQDAANRWWAGWMWRCWEMPDGVANGISTPIDAVRGATRAEAVQAAARKVLDSLPADLPPGNARRIVEYWRRELPAAVERVG
jgi:hypothetical protein